MGRYDNDSGLFSMLEFTNRGVIKLAPDALVFVSGNLGTSVLAPVSGSTQRINFQDGISNISVQNNVDPSGSSTANIEIVTPLYTDKSNYWVSYKGEDGRSYRRPYFVPMMEVKVFFKGRFLVGNEPKHYPVFWGFIVNVEETYSDRTYKITLQCADMLHWWSYINVAFLPSFDSNIMSGGGQGLFALASRYTNSNAFEIIYNLMSEMNQGNFITPDWLEKLPSNRTLLQNPAGLYTVHTGIIAYWKTRFNDFVNCLKMYGARGNLINNPHEPKKQQSNNTGHPAKVSKTEQSQEATRSFILENFTIDDRFIRDFPTFEKLSKIGEVANAEYNTKLDVATQVKTASEYEFFQDVNGNFIFKPPFYNLNTKNLMPYRIKPQDIISYAFGINSEEIVTSLQVETNILDILRDENTVTPVGYHQDIDLTKKYGERFKKVQLWYMGGRGLEDTLAAGHLSLMNVKAFHGNVTIPGRPEIRLGYPVYIEHKDVFYYVQSINHTFDYGGSFITTLSLNGLRERVYDKTDKSDTINGEWFLQKNKIYKLAKKLNIIGGDKINVHTTIAQAQAEQEKDPNKKYENLLRANSYIRSMEPGEYNIVDDPQDGVDRTIIQHDSVPLTDEEGYRCIGSFKYGRGIYLTTGRELINYTLENQRTPVTNKQVVDARQVDMVMSIQSVEDEGNIMSDYHKQNNAYGVEEAVPSYLNMLSQNYNVDDVSKKLVNMLPTN